MQILAPAKINLSLRILGRRNDGFHELDTLIAPIPLNDLFETRVSREARAEMAVPLGSYVPLFLVQSAAVCKGHGEMVMPVKLQRQFSILLLNPAFAVSTAWAYSRLQHSREIPRIR